MLVAVLLPHGAIVGGQFAKRLLLISHRLLLHDPSAAAPLRLVLAALSLHDAPLAPPPFVRGPRDRFVAAKQPTDITTARAKGAQILIVSNFMILQDKSRPPHAYSA